TKHLLDVGDGEILPHLLLALKQTAVESTRVFVDITHTVACHQNPSHPSDVGFATLRRALSARPPHTARRWWLSWGMGPGSLPGSQPNSVPRCDLAALRAPLHPPVLRRGAGLLTTADDHIGRAVVALLFDAERPSAFGAGAPL